jgi:AP2 domain
MRAPCSFKGCETPIVARNCCDKHYRRLLHNGDPSVVKKEQHGLYYTREHGSWIMMIQRCTNPKAGDYYKYYGGRGIKVCQRWLDSFKAFYDDMAPRPKGMSLDRKDNNGNYSCGKCDECKANGWPMNCRWATKFEQALNKRPLTEHQGVNFQESKGKWRAYIRRNNKLKHLGYFDTFEEAFNARKLAEQEYA